MRFLKWLLILAIGSAPAGPVRARAAVSQDNRTKALSTVAPAPVPRLSDEDEAMLAEMPLKRKVGQLLMIGFMGQNTHHSLGKLITTIQPGAVVVFGRNIKTARQISDLNRTAQKISMKATKLPLLIAVDQEGGNVIRIKTTYPLPSALALGQADDSELVERAGSATGYLLKTLGFNMNLAPVLDVGNPKVNRFIGTRTYSHDPHVVARLGSQFARGLEAGGVLPTAKHFPGHGGVSEDSHVNTPSKKSTLQQMERHDLVPFARMAKSEKPWALMLAHIAYPSLDPSGVPATFSRQIVTDLLRGKLGFNGLVVTDDIEMAGASVITDVSERAVRAVEAGVDLIMIAWNKKIQATVSAALVRAVKSGRLSEERINESLRRIIAAKRAYASSSIAAPSLAELEKAVRNPDFKLVAETAMAARFKRKPSSAERAFVDYANEKPVIVFSPNAKFLKEFKAAAGEEHEVRTYQLSGNPNFNIDRVMRSNPQAVGVFHLSGASSSKFAASLGEDVSARMLLVTIEPPGQLANVESFKLIADIYYRHPNLGKLVAEQYFTQASLRAPASASKTKIKSASTSSADAREVAKLDEPDAKAKASNRDLESTETLEDEMLSSAQESDQKREAPKSEEVNFPTDPLLESLDPVEMK